MVTIDIAYGRMGSDALHGVEAEHAEALEDNLIAILVQQGGAFGAASSRQRQRSRVDVPRDLSGARGCRLQKTRAQQVTGPLIP